MSRFVAPFVASRSWAPPPEDVRPTEDAGRMARSAVRLCCTTLSFPLSVTTTTTTKPFRFLTYLGSVMTSVLSAPTAVASSLIMKGSVGRGAKKEEEQEQEENDNDTLVDLEEDVDFESAFVAEDGTTTNGKVGGGGGREMQRRRLYRAFRLFDIDHSGAISLAELRDVLKGGMQGGLRFRRSRLFFIAMECNKHKMILVEYLSGYFFFCLEMQKHQKPSTYFC